MKILVLGGTRFLGRHIVEALAAKGHQVVRFHRGTTQCDLPSGVEERLGDRTGDMSAIELDAWDAIVDVACYEADVVRRSLDLRTDRYLFVSTVSVYADFSGAGITEDAPVIRSFDPSDEAAAYGGKKAACEQLVVERYGDRAIVLRPGLIVGAWDPTGRFTHWCSRARRGGSYLVPKPVNRPVQFVDAADIARFVERAITRGLFGTYNVVGPREPMSMHELLVQCEAVARERGAPKARAVWVEPEFLLESGVKPWTEMPLWLPEAKYAGLLQISNAKAIAAGLVYRPTAETIRSILDWIASAPGAVTGCLAPERESELLVTS